MSTRFPDRHSRSIRWQTRSASASITSRPAEPDSAIGALVIPDERDRAGAAAAAARSPLPCGLKYSMRGLIFARFSRSTASIFHEVMIAYGREYSASAESALIGILVPGVYLPIFCSEASVTHATVPAPSL